jgi:hypothetical protein
VRARSFTHPGLIGFLVGFDFPEISSGFKEMHRVRVMVFFGLDDFDFVFALLALQVFMRLIDLTVGRDTYAIMMLEWLIRSIGRGLMRDQLPAGIGMLENGLTIASLYHFKSQKILQNRQGLLQRTAFIMACHQSCRFQHVPFPFCTYRLKTVLIRRNIITRDIATTSGQSANCNVQCRESIHLARKRSS